MSLTIGLGLGLTMPRPVTGGGGPAVPESEIVGIVTAAGGGALYHPMNPDTAYQERTAGGTTLSGDAGPIGTLRDIGGGGYHAVAPSDAARPILTAGAIYQATYDDVDDDLQAPLPIVGATCTTWTVSDRGLIVRNDVRHVKAGNYRLPRYGLRAFGIIPGALTPAQRALLESYYGQPIIDAAWAPILRAESTSNIRIRTADASSVTIDWGDGVPQTVASNVLTAHSYLSAYSGPVIVTATAAITSIFVNGGNYDGNVGEVPSGATEFDEFVSATIDGEAANLPLQLTTLFMFGPSKLSGNVSELPPALQITNLQNQNTLSGDVSGLPAGVTAMTIWGQNTLSGDVSGLPAGASSISIAGQNTISGNVSGLPAGVIYMVIAGQNTLSGDVVGFPAGASSISISGQNTISVSTTIPWNTSLMRNVELNSALTSTEVDNLLMTLAQTATWTNEKKINLDVGTNAPRTTASDAAVATLTGYGVLVETF